jgi:hypothetical protein
MKIKIIGFSIFLVLLATQVQAGLHSYAKRLPLLKEGSPWTLQANQRWKFKLVLGKNWKMNLKGPSWVAVFLKDAKGNYQNSYEISRFKPEGGEFEMPQLNPGSAYRFQGTFYYCGKEDVRVCKIASYDIPISVDKHLNGINVVELNLD